MKVTLRCLSVSLLIHTLAGAAGAAPRLQIGPVTQRLELPGLRACYVARVPGPGGAKFSFLTTGAALFSMDTADNARLLMNRTNLFGVVTDPELGALLCTNRGVFATRDGRLLRRVSPMVFTRVIAAPVGGLFARPGEGLYGFDGEQFQLIRPIPWRTIECLAIEPGGDAWFVGACTRPDGSEAPTRLYVSRLRNGAPVIEDPLPAEESASAVADYFGGIVATVDGKLRGTLDGGRNWVTFDDFGRVDLTLASLPLFEGQPWQALWIGVRTRGVGPAPLWFDDYISIAALPINTGRVLQVTANLFRQTMLFVGDGALFEAPYQVVDDSPAR